MGPIEMLKEDHELIRSLLRELKQPRAANRARLLDQLGRALALHTALEEELIYPLMVARVPKMEEEVVLAMEEHDLVKVLLAELEEIGVQHPRHLAKVRVLDASFERHVDREESQLFPRLTQKLRAAERDELAASLEEAEARGERMGTPTRLARPAVLAGIRRGGRRAPARRATGRKTAGQRAAGRLRRPGKKKTSRKPTRR